MRSRAVAAALAALLSGALPLAIVASPAAAQEEEPEVRLLLLEQTPYASRDRALRVRVAAVNEGEAALEDLTMTLTIYFPARSRSEYAQALETEPTTAALLVRAFDVPGTLDPGGTLPLPPIADPRLRALVAQRENALYPMKVQLESAGVPVAALRTALMFIRQEPKVPLNVALSFVLDERVRVLADGTLLDDTLERSISPGGRLDTIVSALEAFPLPVTVVISPAVLEQLVRMGGGYRVAEGGEVREVAEDDQGATRATRMLERLRGIARRPIDTPEVVALPYGSPSVPALVRAGLEPDLADHIRRGRDVVSEVLGTEPSPVFRPPGSALSRASLHALERLDIRELLLDGRVLPPDEGQALTATGAAEIAAGGGESFRALAPDPIVEERIESIRDDPRLAAQQTIGELSAIYVEQPSVDRGVSVIIGEGDPPSRAFLRLLFRAITARQGLRWLRAVTTTRLLVGQTDQDAERRDLGEVSRASLAPTVVTKIAEARDAISQLESMADQPALIDRLRDVLLLAESRHLVGSDIEAIELLDSVDAAVDAEFGKVGPPSSGSITLTSREGVIPLTLHNEAGYPVQLELLLRSRPALEVLGAETREVTLSRPVQRVLFRVRAQTTGRFPVVIEVSTPQGEQISSTSIVVRSTAYNRVALLVTIGAAVFLAAWWASGLVARRRA